jgi:hypothetical protein
MSGITSSVLYAETDANPTFPGYVPGRKEKLITSMEISQMGGSEDRIAALETKLQDMEPLVKGLIAELLDFKAVAMSMSRQAEESSRQELKQGPVIHTSVSPGLAVPSVSSSDGSTIIRPRGAHQPDVPVVPAEPEMVRIMQTDGTMKMEPRYGEKNAINSSVGYGRTRKGASDAGRQAPLIYAADEDKSGSTKK